MDHELLKNLAEACEQPFRFGGYRGNPLAKTGFSAVVGDIPVLISVPHCVRQPRENREKPHEFYTGALGVIAQSLTGCFLIFSQRTSESDPNYSFDSDYKEALQKLIGRHGIKAVIDLHGASLKRGFDADLGTGGGQTMSASQIATIQEIFKANGLGRVFENHTFSASERTISYFAFHSCGASSVQIEINAALRMPGKDPEKFASLVRAVAQTVMFLKDSAN